MFKDLYKQANDNINTDEAKARVMARLQKPVPVVRKTYRVQKIAALAACFVLTIAAAGIYENVQKKPQTIPQQVVEKAVTPDVASQLQDAPAIPAHTPAPKAAEPAKKDAKSVPAQTPDVKKALDAPVADYAVENDSADIPTDAIPVTPQAEYATEEKISSGGGGGGAAKSTAPLVVNEVGGTGANAAVARLAIPQSEEKHMTIEEYQEYIGKNILEQAVLPDGVENETFPVQSIPADEDKFTFQFMGEGKLVQIETTKNTDTVQEIIENPAYEKSYIGETPAVVLNENEILKAYLASDGVGYFVTMINCTETELTNLLESLN